MDNTIKNYAKDIIGLCETLDTDAVEATCELLLETYKSKKKIFIAGNGGRAGTANHFTCDFGKNAVKSETDRPRIISLSANIEVLTALGNDFCYADVFLEELKNLMDDGDSFVKVEFWLDGESPEAQVDAIIQTLHTIKLREIRLGSSPYFLRVLDSYKLGEMTEDDIADHQVAYFASEESLVDFDVYQFPKKDAAQELSQYVLEEAAMYDKASEIDTNFVINGIPTAWYRTPDTYADQEYDTLTCILDNDTEYVEIVFWMDGQNAQQEVNAIIKSLSKLQAEKVELAGSGYAITLPGGFRKGEVKDADVAIGHVAFYYDIDDTLEMDVYKYSKADMDGNIGVYLENLAKEGAEELTYEVNAAVNDIPVAWCRYEAEFNGEAIKTISYFLDVDDEYVEISFWLKGENSEAAAEKIINTLKAL